MSVNVAKLTVTVPRPLAAAVDDIASEESRTRSDVVREAIERLVKERSDRRITEAFGQWWSAMTPEDRAEYDKITAEAEPLAREAWELTMGSEDEGEWW